MPDAAPSTGALSSWSGSSCGQLSGIRTPSLSAPSSTPPAKVSTGRHSRRTRHIFAPPTAHSASTSTSCKSLDVWSATKGCSDAHPPTLIRLPSTSAASCTTRPSSRVPSPTQRVFAAALRTVDRSAAGAARRRGATTLRWPVGAKRSSSAWHCVTRTSERVAPASKETSWWRMNLWCWTRYSSSKERGGSAPSPWSRATAARSSSLPRAGLRSMARTSRLHTSTFSCTGAKKGAYCTDGVVSSYWPASVTRKTDGRGKTSASCCE
mmetsp:Transcript_34009/g.109214  ORF Transcript_34009/g.109214 Transcript_34009/m.109214 type:complete len:266 (-) Transcript_34009:858-1655(-)